jgi:hypothetical protein
VGASLIEVYVPILLLKDVISSSLIELAMQSARELRNLWGIYGITRMQMHRIPYSCLLWYKDW